MCTVFQSITTLTHTRLYGPQCKRNRKPRSYKKKYSCLTQLSTKFQLLIKTNMLKNKEVSCFKSLSYVFIMLINVKMPTIVGILTFMSRIISCSAELSMKSFITSGPVFGVSDEVRAKPACSATETELEN